jgi:hypothetical protein
MFARVHIFQKLFKPNTVYTAGSWKSLSLNEYELSFDETNNMSVFSIIILYEP